MIQGMGLLFVMWNIPYLVALIHPLKRLISLVEAGIMQAIGVIGETFLLWKLPDSHPILEQSVRRFILFDGCGLVLLIGALVLILILRSRQNQQNSRF